MRGWLAWLSGLWRPQPQPTPTPDPPGPAPTEFVRIALAEVNRERAAHGEQPVAHDLALDKLAGSWCMQMAATGRQQHGNTGARIDTVYPGRAWAENVGVASSPVAIVAAWMGDTLHQRNMLGPYNRAGVGYAPDSRTGQPAASGFWCLDLVADHEGPA